MNQTEYENRQLKKMLIEWFEMDSSITKFRILQIAGMEN